MADRQSIETVSRAAPLMPGGDASAPLAGADANAPQVGADPSAPHIGADEAMMRRAIALAVRAIGETAPNPMVGCVIARGDTIIGEGWHAGPGKPHAEAAAIADAHARGQSVHGATAYVTLEPCHHYGRTGPCTGALIEARIARVVYAIADPNPVAAGGANFLKSMGVTVTKGLRAGDVRHMMRGWLGAQHLARPYVMAKSAMSLDGRIATHTGDSQWITGAEARAMGHGLRMEADAILVGANTVITDDPALTARAGGKTRRAPLRVILDSTGRTPPGAKVFERRADGIQSALLVATPAIAHARKQAFERMGVGVIMCETGPDGRPDPHAVLAHLGDRGIVSVLIEGGGASLGAFFDAGLVDEFHLFQAPIVIGGGAPGLAGNGFESLAKARDFTFEALGPLGHDHHWRAMRRFDAQAETC